jgi:hypothetical protein
VAEFSASQIDKGATPPQVFSATQIEREPTPKPRGQVFWETIGGQALQDMIGGASRDPVKAQKALDTFKGLVHGIADEPARVWGQLAASGEAMTRGDIPAAAHHLGGAVPFIGKTAQDVESDVRKGNYGDAVERTAGMVAPFIAPRIPGAIADAAPAVADAAHGAYLGGTTPSTLKLNVKGVPIEVPTPVPAAVTAGTTGALVGSKVAGMPGAVTGGVVGAAIPIVRGAMKGGKAILAERLAAAMEKIKQPEPPPEAPPIPAPPPGFGVAGGSTLAAPPAATPRPAGYQPPVTGALPGQGATAPPAAAEVTPPLKPLAQMTRAEIIEAAGLPADATPSQIAQAVAAGPIAPSKTLAQELADEYGTGKAPITSRQPEPIHSPATRVDTPPEVRASQAANGVVTIPSGSAARNAAAGPAIEQQARNAKVQALAKVLHEHGITPEDARQIEGGQWKALAQAIGINAPSGTSIAQTIGELRRMEQAANPPAVMKNPQAAAIAQQLADEMKHSGTLPRN